MRCFHKRSMQRAVAILTIAVMFGATSGCATLAHDSSFGGAHVRTVSQSNDGEVCPWLWGDVGLLFLFVVPGVVGFIVDFGTGAWRHPHAHVESDANTVAFNGPSDRAHSDRTRRNPAP